MKVKISTTSLVDLYLNYRMPADSPDKSNPVLEVYIPSRGLLVECLFPSENHFEEFKKQNAEYINSKVIIFGDKVKGNEVEKISKDKSKKEAEKVENTFNKAVDQVEDMAKDAKVKMNIETIKDK